MMYRKVQTARYNISKRVLIVETDGLTRNVLSKIITNYLGCDVNIASNAREAESFMRSIVYDLFVIGISRDIEKDIDLIKRLQVFAESVPIIIVIGDCNESDLNMVKRLGIDRIAYKPLKLTPFLEIVAGVFIEKGRVFNYT